MGEVGGFGSNPEIKNKRTQECREILASFWLQLLFPGDCKDGFEKTKVKTLQSNSENDTE